MTTELLLALMGFAFVSSITPGPNNLMLLSSGVTFGFWRTVPHMLGIGFGFMLLLATVGFGLAEVFERWPTAYTLLKIAGATYLLYLAWKIAHAGPLEAREGRARPFSFLQAAAFQWVNPKAWVMAVTAMTLYVSPADFTQSVLIVTLVFGLINVPSVSVWTLFGTGLRQILRQPRAVRIFNMVMAGLLVASLVPMLS